jgi:hypothetical protein
MPDWARWVIGITVLVIVTVLMILLVIAASVGEGG